VDARFVNQFRLITQFQSILMSKALNTPARTAIKQALRLEMQEAPQRERDRRHRSHVHTSATGEAWARLGDTRPQLARMSTTTHEEALSSVDRTLAQLEHLLPVARVLPAPRAVMELGTVRARAFIVFRAGHAVRRLGIDPRTFRRTLLGDMSVLARRFVGTDDLRAGRWRDEHRQDP
jgi:hypothetical protein